MRPSTRASSPRWSCSPSTRCSAAGQKAQKTHFADNGVYDQIFKEVREPFRDIGVRQARPFRGAGRDPPASRAGKRSRRATRHPGVRADPGIYRPLPQPHRPHPAFRHLHQGLQPHLGRSSWPSSPTGRCSWPSASASLASAAAALINAVFGLLVAWVLVRYRFPGRGFLDSLVDLPFALPTAVAGIALTAVYAPTGWIGEQLEPARHPGGLYAPGRDRGPHLHRPALRGAHPAAGAGGPGQGSGGGRLLPGRQPLADLHRGSSFPPSLPSLFTGRVPGLRPRPGRIRFGHLHLRQHAHGDRNRPPHHRQQAGAVRLRRRHRGGLP